MGERGYVTNKSITGKIDLPPKFSRSQFFFHIVFISDSKRSLSIHTDPRSDTVRFSYLQRFFFPRYDTGTAEMRPPGRTGICSAPSTGLQNPPRFANLFQCPHHRSVPGTRDGGTFIQLGFAHPPLRRSAPSRPSRSKEGLCSVSIAPRLPRLSPTK